MYVLVQGSGAVASSTASPAVVYDGGDTNGDSLLDAKDAASTISYLTGQGPTVADTNFDGQTNSYDVIFLLRAASRLIPVLKFHPSVTPVGSNTMCSLIVTASTSSIPASQAVFFVLSHEGEDFQLYLNATEIMAGNTTKQVIGQNGIFEAVLTNSTTGMYTAALDTPIDYNFQDVGLSVITITVDARGTTYASRVSSYIRSSPASSFNRLSNLQLVSSQRGFTMNNIVLGEEKGIIPLRTFTNSIRSDFCDFSGSTIRIYVPEDQMTDIIFHNISAIVSGFPDEDETYGLVGSPSIPFEINSNGGLSLNGQLDYDEGQQSYVFNVGLMYAPVPLNQLQATVIVNVTDVNDNAPSFNPPSYDVSFSEITPVETTLAVVSASDIDSGMNAMFEFTIEPSSDPRSQFAINATSGEIVLVNSLDRETTAVHNVTILATDFGEPRMTGTAQLIINVLDVNDNAPMFALDEFVLTILEDIYKDSDVFAPMATVNVSDPDFGENATITLSLIVNESFVYPNSSYSNPAGLFDIADNGAIIVTGSLDREEVDRYSFTVLAVDGGDPAMNSTVSLTIVVGDVNDNPPIFVEEGGMHFVEEDLVVGTVIVQLLAEDRDIGSNANITYEIIGEAPGFEIDPVTGEFRVAPGLSISADLNQIFVIRARDNGVPRMNDTTDIMVTIIEGQLVRFNITRNGFLVESPERVDQRSYSQGAGYIFGADIGAAVDVSGRIGTADSRAFENTNIANPGGEPTQVNGRVLQDRVYHSQRTVTVFIRAADDRGVVAISKRVRVEIVPSALLEALSNQRPVVYCTTSLLGYCIARVPIPDQWFERNVTSQHFVTVYVATAVDTGPGREVRKLDVQAAPSHAPWLTPNPLFISPPSHPVYPSTSFGVEIFIISPLAGNFYTRFTANVLSPVVPTATFGQGFSCTFENSVITCNTVTSELSTDNALKLADLTFETPDSISPITIELSNIQLGTTSSSVPYDPASVTVTVNARSPSYFYVMSPQPNLVNTVTLDGRTSMSSVTLVLFENDLAARSLTSSDMGEVVQFDQHNVACTATDATNILIHSADCSMVYVNNSTMNGGNVTFTYTVGASSFPSLLSPINDQVTFYVWVPTNVSITIPDTVLSRVQGWREEQCSGEESYQNTRLEVHAQFTDGAERFTWDIYDRVSHLLVPSHNVKILTQYSVIQGLSIGPASIKLPRSTPGASVWADAMVNVNNVSLNPIKLEPVVASLRLTADNPASHLVAGSVSVEILPGLFFAGEETEVTVSVILNDGRRLLITNPNEIDIQSSNSSIVSVGNSNFITAERGGSATLNVGWVVCNQTLISALVDVQVQFDENRPTFNPERGQAIVPEDSSIGTFVFQVTATDEDGGIHAEIRYNIRDDPFNGLFEIDPITGRVTLNGGLDREQKEIYVLRIEATDRQQRQALACRMAMTGTTDSPTTTSPTTSNGNGNGNDTESSGSGSDMLDPSDTPTEGTTTPITTPTPDCDPVADIAVFELTINVGDINDNSPICPSRSVLHITNSTEPRTIITRYTAEDADIGENGRVTYILRNSPLGREINFFRIDPNTGDIYTLVPIPQRPLMHTPIIIATDGGNRVQICQLNIAVYEYQHTVSVMMAGNGNDFNSDVFAQLVEDILSKVLGFDVDIQVANITMNGTDLFSVLLYALDSQNLVIDADRLSALLSNLSDADRLRLQQAGFDLLAIDSNKPPPTPSPPITITRVIPTWAVIVIIVFNSVIIIAVLLLILGLLWRRYVRIREKENQRRLNKQRGLRSMESLFEEDEEGELVEMGGIHDPEKGAMMYERRTEVTMEESQETGKKKKVKKIVEQTSWIGPNRGKKKAPKLLDDDEEEAPPILQEESNPLYSSREYVSDFTNPIYTSQAEADESGGGAVLGTESVEIDENTALVTDSGGDILQDPKDPGMDEADTLF